MKSSNGAAKDPTSIGNILIDMGLIVKDELERLAEEFNKSDKDELLGQFLLRYTNISAEEIELALIRQRRMRGETVNYDTILKALDLSRRTQQKLRTRVDLFVQSMSKK